jgi:hypothetical protein
MDLSYRNFLSYVVKQLNILYVNDIYVEKGPTDSVLSMVPFQHVCIQCNIITIPNKLY